MSEEMVCRKRRLSSFQIIILGGQQQKEGRGRPGRAAADAANFCDSSVCNAVQ